MVNIFQVDGDILELCRITEINYGDLNFHIFLTKYHILWKIKVVNSSQH